MLQKLLSCDVELLKAPYMFDMVNAKESADERDIEKLLVEHITKYLLEMGNGFDFDEVMREMPHSGCISPYGIEYYTNHKLFSDVC